MRPLSAVKEEYTNIWYKKEQAIAGLRNLWIKHWFQAATMKRGYGHIMDLPPSPDSSEQEEDIFQINFDPRRKRSREYKVTHQFNELIEDSLLDFISSDGNIVRKKFRSQGKPLVLIFYGVMNDYLDEINDKHDRISTLFNADIIGVSSNISHNEYSFPVIDSTYTVKKFNMLDPVGGGVYPRDVMFVFDRFGKQKHEVPIRHLNRMVQQRPVVDVLCECLEDVTSEMKL